MLQVLQAAYTEHFKTDKFTKQEKMSMEHLIQHLRESSSKSSEYVPAVISYGTSTQLLNATVVHTKGFQKNYHQSA